MAFRLGKRFGIRVCAALLGRAGSDTEDFAEYQRQAEAILFLAGCDAGELFPLKEFQGSAAAGGDMT
ncbi:MAG: hypothetical protein IJO94_01300, partial [Firmicutes bacterium]|nr:hypothetical protein [Bacillota bacterium]